MAKIVRVTWTDPSPTTNVDHLEIWRSVNAGAAAQVGTDLALGVQTYDDDNGGSGFADADDLDYSVRAYNATGQYSEVTGNIIISGGGATAFTMNVTAGEVNEISTNVWGNNLTAPNVYDDCNLWSTETFAGAFHFECDIDDIKSRGICMGIATINGERKWDQYLAGVLIANSSNVIYYIESGSITSTGTSATWTAGDKLSLRRDASNNVTIYYNDTLIHTFATTKPGTSQFKGSVYNVGTINNSVLDTPVYY